MTKPYQCPLFSSYLEVGACALGLKYGILGYSAHVVTKTSDWRPLRMFFQSHFTTTRILSLPIYIYLEGSYNEITGSNRTDMEQLYICVCVYICRTTIKVRTLRYPYKGRTSRIGNIEPIDLGVIYILWGKGTVLDEEQWLDMERKLPPSNIYIYIVEG